MRNASGDNKFNMEGSDVTINDLETANYLKNRLSHLICNFKKIFSLKLYLMLKNENIKKPRTEKQIMNDKRLSKVFKDMHLLG